MVASSKERDAPKQRVLRLGKYETIAQIGTGGMAEVYLARQRGPMNFEKVVVVKTIHPHLAKQDEFIEMFLEEARISALLKHPRCVDIYDLGVSDGTYFLAMEYLAGEPLSEIVLAGRVGHDLDVFGTAWIIAECAEGLHFAHELTSIDGRPLGLVHRDVTPGNVIVLYSGHVKLVDFGVAKARGRAVETGQRKLKGKLGYASPEQLHGEELDRRSDIFSLGIVMWETLTRRRLYAGTSEAAIVNAILHQPPPPPSMLRPEVPRELDDICLKALSKNKDDRYATAEELQRDLETLLRAANYHDKHRPIARYMHKVFDQRIASRRRLLGHVKRANTATGEVPAIDIETPPIQAADDAGQRSRRVTGSHSGVDLPLTAPPSGVVDLDEVEMEIEAEAPGDTADEVEIDFDAPDEPADEDSGAVEMEVAAAPAERRGRGGVWLAAALLVAAAAGFFVYQQVVAKDEASATDREGTSAAAADSDERADEHAALTTSPHRGGDTEPTVEDDDESGNDESGDDEELVDVEPLGGDEATGDDEPGDDETGDDETGGDEGTAPHRDRRTHHRRDKPDKPPRSDDGPRAPATAASLYKEGLQLYVKGALKEAKKKFRASLVKQPDYAPAHRGLGMVYEKAGNKRRAIEAFRTYLRLAPNGSAADQIRARLERLGG